jgi:TrmH family RNA methyltransferase
MREGVLTDDGLLPVEGSILIGEAARSGLEIVDVFVREGTGVPPVMPDAVYEVPPELFKTIQDTEHSQGVIATVRPHQFTPGDVLSGSPALVVVLARLQDPGNAGTILRVAESFGATGCIALRGTAGFHNGKVVRASAGSVFRIPHVLMTPAEVARALKSRGIAVVGTSPTVATTVETWDWQKATAVIIGNEGSGLNSEEFALCDTVLRVPHKETVESLNSAIAAAVILYEAAKQRHLI